MKYRDYELLKKVAREIATGRFKYTKHFIKSMAFVIYEHLLMKYDGTPVNVDIYLNRLIYYYEKLNH